LTRARARGDGRQAAVYLRLHIDTHLYERTLNQRFVRGAVKAVEDVNALDPQPDFVLFGGDLAQLGRRGELDLGKQILSELKAPVKMMVGEHDWFYDLGEAWKTCSARHLLVRLEGRARVVLMSVYEKDFWTARKLSPAERMQIVAGLDNGIQSRFEVGADQRKWLSDDLAKVPHTTPLLVFSHSRSTSTTATGISGPKMRSRCRQS